MAKGQMRSNRETKKPKAVKAGAADAPSSTLSTKAVLDRIAVNKPAKR